MPYLAWAAVLLFVALVGAVVVDELRTPVRPTDELLDEFWREEEEARRAGR